MSEYRKTITSYFSDFDPFQLDGLTAKQCADVFQRIDEKHPDKLLTLCVKGYGYDGGIEVSLQEKRLENDKEYQARLEYQYAETERRLKQSNLRAVRERETYEKLKAKFGDV